MVAAKEAVAASERACARANVYNSSSTSTRGGGETARDGGSSADLLLSLSSLSLLSLSFFLSLWLFESDFGFKFVRILDC